MEPAAPAAKPEAAPEAAEEPESAASFLSAGQAPSGERAEEETKAEAKAEPKAEAKRSPEENGEPKAGSSTTGPDASGQFNIDAPAFVPRVEDEQDIMSQLPNHHRSRLRNFYQAYNGSYCAYYVGTLKSFNTRNGYGFLSCTQAKKDFGVDVFIHKNNVSTPWFLGQPVEFAVQVNTRGQPQAYDCNWLPRLPPQGNKVTPGTVPAVPGAGPYPSAGSSSSNANAVPEPKKEHVPKVPKMSEEPRRLGTLKSFSATHGYGFIDCGETKSAYQRDVYLDKSQMRESGTWQWGQLLEFSVSFNDRGNPQAQKVNWEPVPIMNASSANPAWKRTYTEKTVEQLKRLLKLLHEKNPETAIVTAIDLQGGSSPAGSAAQPAPQAPTDADVDYVFFVLDRLDDKEDVLKSIKDFVKMLFVLMLSRMLRMQPDVRRVEQLIEWYEAVAQAIQTTSDAVKQHFQDVVKQINTHIQNATKDNVHLQDETLRGRLFAAFTLLKDKANAR